MANLYIVIGMDSLTDFTVGIWVTAVATAGVGALKFTRVVVVVGIGWVRRILTFYPLLVITVLLLLSFTFGAGAFLTMGLVLD